MISSTLFVLSFALFLSLPLIFLFAPQILPPRHAAVFPDEIEDLNLFHKATAVPSTHSPSTHARIGGAINPKPKIAFLFLTNSDLSFAPLWEKFFQGNNKNKDLYNIYIHADPFSKITPPGGVFEGRFIKARKTERASPTLITAVRRLLAEALLDDPLNQYFTLLSQHCVPLHSFNFVYKHLFNNTLTALRAFSTQPKYQSFIEILSDEPTLPDRYNARGENVMLPEVPFEEFRVGSQFFTLTRRHALLVVKDTKLWSKFRLPCLNNDSCYPEEHYFPTLLSMEDPKGCTHYTLTRVNWTDSLDGHPHTYTPEEVSAELVPELRKSNSTYSHFFARKFLPDCLKPLMKIADYAIFRD